jgi:hypothetical protein
MTRILKKKEQVIIQVRDDSEVTIKKARPMDLIYLRSIESMLTEWNSQNDEEDYRDL